MIESVFRSTRVRVRLQQSVLGRPVYEAVTSYLVDRRHPLGTVQQYVQSIEHFDRWLRRTRLPVSALGEEAVTRFLDAHLPQCRCPAPACTTRHQVRTSLRHLLRVLRSRGSIGPGKRTEDASPSGVLTQEFVDYLRDVRGTARSTCTYYRRYACEFLAANFGDGKVDMACIEPAAVTRFVTERRSRWTTGSMQAASTGLRSFFRFLQVTGRGQERLVQVLPLIPDGGLRPDLARAA